MGCNGWFRLLGSRKVEVLAPPLSKMVLCASELVGGDCVEQVQEIQLLVRREK